MHYDGLNRNSLKYRATSAFTAFCILAQSLQWAAYGLIIESIIDTPFNMAYANTDLQEELRQKFKTDDPYGNYKGTEARDRVLNKTYRQSNQNLEAEIIEKYYNAPQTPSTAIDLSKYDNGRTFQDNFSDSVDEALNTPVIIAPPSQTSSGSIRMNHTVRPGMTVTKDSTGKLVFEQKAAVPGATHKNLEMNEIMSAEVNHADITNESSEQYGKEDEYYEEGRERFTELKTTTSSDALVYKSLMASKDSNPIPIIHGNNPILGFSKDALDDAKAGEGIWGQDCTATTTTETSESHYPVWERHMCSEPNKENLNSCVVSRELEFPIQFKTVDGTMPISTDISFKDDETLVIKMWGGAEDIEDARHFNDQYGIDEFRSSDCRVMDKQIIIQVAPGYRVESAIRIGDEIDDVFREFINGQKTLDIRGDYSHNQYWSAIPQTDKRFPSHYYNQFPVDAYLTYKNNILSSNYKNCERGDKDIPETQNLTSAFNNHNGEISIELLLGVGGHGHAQVQYEIKFDKPIEPVVQYKQAPEGCADSVGWVEPPPFSQTPEGEGDENKETPEQGGLATGGFANVNFNTLEEDNTGAITGPGGVEIGGGSSGEGGKLFCQLDEWQCVEGGTLGLDPTILATVPPMYEGDTEQICTKINATGYRCDPLEGETICQVQSDGSEICYDWQELRTTEDTCGVYKEDETCYEKQKTCQDGWLEGRSDRCFMWQVEYECDAGPTVVKEREVTENMCAGALPCLGNDCDFGEQESNTDFAQAAAYTEMINYMSTDTSCTDPEDPSTCTIFQGERKYCSWEVSGLGTDCCEAPEGVNFMEYLQMTMYMNKVANATSPAYKKFTTNMAESSWEYLANSETGQWVGENIYKPITSAAESAIGTLSEYVTTEGGKQLTTSGGTQVGAATMQDQMMKSAYDFLGGENGIGGALMEKSATEGGKTVMSWSGPMQSAMTYMGYIMWAYMAYQMIKLLLQIISACDEEEMDMGMRIFQRQCFEIDNDYCNKKVLGVCLIKRQDWCCYDSMLARIVMEQAYPMIGKDASECSGLALPEMEALDWDRIDLTEWIAAMVGAGTMPDEDCQTEQCLLDRQLDNGEDRMTSEEKSVVYQEQNWADRAIDIRNKMDPDQVDCSVYPQPIACRLDGGN